VYAWVVARVLRNGFSKLSSGDPAPVLNAFAPGARWNFPGEHSWALDSTDHDEIAAWFHRFATHGFQIVVDDIVVKGPPWNTSVCSRGSDRLVLPDGRTYENQWCQFARLRWGKLHEDRIYVDTQRVATLDRWLAEAR
jgi:ketosteroid isomerase-like protein